MERALKHYPLAEVSGHFHDTYGQALANIYACLEIGRAHLRRQHRRPRRLPVCQGRDRQRRDRGRGLHAATASASRPASTSTRWSTPAPSSPSVLGRAPVSRGGTALLAKRGKAFDVMAERANDPKAFSACARRSPSSAIRTRRCGSKCRAHLAGGGRRARRRGRADRQERDLPAPGDDARGARRRLGRPARRREEGGAAGRRHRPRRCRASSRRAPASRSAAWRRSAHATPPVTLIDRELFRFGEIWAAAGHPNGVFKLTPAASSTR